MSQLKHSPNAPVKRRPPGRLSLVIPLFNEEETLPYLRERLDEWRAGFAIPAEVVLVDDGSTDNSLVLLRAWAASDASVRVVSFSKNFGHQIALTAALEHSTGDVMVILDADLQDPLETIPRMVEKYIEGYEIVYGRRTERRGEGTFKRFSAWGFYRFMRLLIEDGMPADAGDFRLVSRKCVDVLLSMPEHHRFLRGLFSWMGFPQAAVDYVREPRRFGRTKYPLFKMMRFAGNAVLSFSPLPIRIISLVGAAIAMLGFAYGVYAAARWFWAGDTVAGWPTIVVLISLIGGMILLSLGVVGEYVSRIYETVKGRPLYIVRETINTTPLQR